MLRSTYRIFAPYYMENMEEKQMILRTEDLVKKYRNRTVVNHVSVNG